VNVDVLIFFINTYPVTELHYILCEIHYILHNYIMTVCACCQTTFVHC